MSEAVVRQERSVAEQKSMLHHPRVMAGLDAMKGRGNNGQR